MDLKYVVADPAGNITGIVITRHPRQDYRTIARHLMEHSPYGLEQVGFLRDCADCDGSLEMMGGEFCGNASRSVGLYLAKRSMSMRDDRVLIRVSGAEGKLEVLTDLKRNEAKIRMPRILAMDWLKTRDYEEVPIVIMEGIAHVLLLDRHPDKEKAEHLIKTLSETRTEDAIGIMYYEQEHHFMTPLVWVRETDTRVWESSCGSGSVALAAYLERNNQEPWSRSFKEPGGVLKVEETEGEIYLGGPVIFTEVITTEI